MSEETWLFEVGSYQVCHKWLKDRRGSSLSIGEIAAYRQLVSTVERTIRTMDRIDTIIGEYGGWPLRGAVMGV